MANKAVHLPVLSGPGQTLRKDAWWVGPAVTFTILTSFIVYATFRAFENAHFTYGEYLSPFYSPLVETKTMGIPFLTPAMLILPFPAGFRFTCYYYRKAYYRSFAMSPPACAVGGIRQGQYNGERKLMIFQNLHRFALYAALLFLVFLWHDFYKGLWFGGHLGVRGGTVMLFLNCAFLSLYTFSCHSFRHLVGGGLDSYSTAPLGALRHKVWGWVSRININHMAFAWISLFGVALTDLYIRALSTGAISDLRIF
jgi:hypothetical protein